MVSLLDIIGPVMVGPSSSHTAGACRIGLLARNLVGGTPEKVAVAPESYTGTFLRTVLQAEGSERRSRVAEPHAPH